MKLVAKLFAVAALAASIAAHADGERKEATIDFGKGAFKLIVSVPDFADGPYDFAKNKGPRINGDKSQGVMYGEVMFNAAIGESGVVVYQANAVSRSKINTAAKGEFVETLAQSMIKDRGFEGRAQKIACPPAPMEGAKMACYKMSGDAIFDGKVRKEKSAAVIAAVSFANDTMGYTLMGTVAERDAVKFNADQAKYEKMAKNAVGDLWKNHSIK